MHPKVNPLHMEFGSVQKLVVMSGSPIFNNKGKIVGMLFASRYGSIYGLSSTALDVVLTFYKVEIEKNKKRQEEEETKK
jgi:hypothetical protein